MKTLLTFTALSVFTLVASAAWDDFKLEDKSTLQHSFNATRLLDVDNINGFTDVISDGGKTIRLEGQRIIRAKDQQAMELAKKEVTVDFTEKEGTARAYVNGPFRSRERTKRDYQVTYNFTLHVPAAVDLQLRSVNGHVSVKDVRGKFDINTVNGKLDMTGIRGSGKARAVNGATHVEFLENPAAECSISTVNGKIDLTLPAKANALLKFKTVNGHVYTDFEGMSGTITGRLDRGTPREFKIGSGNPVIELQTVNGGIQIKKGK